MENWYQNNSLIDILRVYFLYLLIYKASIQSDYG